jgi:23S rRNA (uracil1939-C5)-methyltransferase
MSYPDQLRYKQGKVIGLLGKYCRVSDIVGMDVPYHYRNKVQAAFGRDRRGIISGVYQSSSHRIVPIDSCLIEDKKADEVIVTVRKLMASFKLEPFNDNTLRGFMRHVLVKRSFSTGQLMVVLVTGTAVFPCKNDFIAALHRAHPEITTIVQNINDKFTNLVLGKRSILLFGEGKIEDELLSCRFRISPKSFYQINPVQTEKLYSIAMDYAGLTGSETVLDAYCGTGTIGIFASAQAKKVTGVELNPDAIRDAHINAKLNGVENIEFFCADAGDFMVEAANSGAEYDVVIMDPPRAGASLAFLRSLVTLAPKKVVYISCNPETQARDLSFLTRKGYKVRRIQPVDMFPHTEHVETVVLLTKI